VKDKKCLCGGRKGHFKVCPKHTGQGTPWIERLWIRRLSRLAESETRTLTKKAEDTKLSATSMRRPKLLSQGGEGGEMVMIVYPMMDGNNFEKSSLRHRTTEHPGLKGTSGGHPWLKCYQLQFNFPRQGILTKKTRLGMETSIPSWDFQPRVIFT
jgi:hypothetical protein